MTTRKKKSTTRSGANKTGTATSPVDAKQSKQGAQQAREFTSESFETLHKRIVEPYANDEEPIGTMPPPASVKGAASAAIGALTGTNANALLDRIGERIAFERTGTRLYELLLLKYDLHGTWDGGPSREELERHRAQEHDHFVLLCHEMQRLGGDPHAMTPAADLAAVESMGLHHVIADGRTNLGQALHAIHVAELTDRDAWEMLIELARSLDEDEAAHRFERALKQEEEHLRDVRRWHRAYTQLQSTLAAAK